MHKVVFVDDDPMILKGIQRIFKRESSIAVYTENNAIDGLRLVKKISPEVVVSDMLMPEIKGDEFLEQVRNYDMQIIRVILSGYSQREDTLRVLINGTCQWFFSKPWDRSSLVRVIKHLINLHVQLRDIELLTLISRFPESNLQFKNFHHIINLVNADCNHSELEFAIMEVPDLTYKIIDVANSLIAEKKIASLGHAMTLLGRTSIKNITLSFDILKRDAVPQDISVAIDHLWKRAILQNQFLQKLYPEVIGLDIPDKFSCIGLLMNCGHILTIKSLPEICLKSCPKVDLLLDEDHLSKALSIDINTVTAYFLDWWGLPSEFMEATLANDFSNEREYLNRDFTYMTHIAKLFCLWKEGDDSAQIDPHILNYFKMPSEEFRSIYSETISS